MAEIEVIKETPLALVEMKEKLQEIKKRDKELNFRAKKTEEYLGVVAKTKLTKALELKNELEKLDIARLKPNQIIKLVDVLPKDMDSLRMMFSSESLTLKAEDLTKILDIVKKYA